MARGPAYPFVNLRTAVELLDKLYKFAKRSPALIDSIAKDAWGWSPTSSTPKKAVAALKYFGLAEEAGTDGNSVRVTDKGYRILVDHEGSPERTKALQEAALLPAQYAYCYKEWGVDVPPSARSKLIFERNFVSTTVDGFLKDYKATMEFAGLNGGEQVDREAVPDEVSADASKGVNSAEQTMTAGMARQPPFQTPSQGRIISEVGIAMRQDVFSVDEGAVTIQWPASLSKDSLKDVEDWLEIVKRKLTRSLKEQPDSA